jgi:anaerobic selenocysteine-containing dehydrogenase
MTNGWIDIKNTDMMLIMGGNPAENHPCGFKWAVEAKLKRNAKIIVVDPRFTRTASQADQFLQIRAGSDIAFLGGVINYALENNRVAKDYLVNYTNAAFIIKQDIQNNRRILKPQVRRPGSDHWDDISWNQAIDEIARWTKKTRDATFIETDAKGQTVNRCESIAFTGGCTDTNEFNYLVVKTMRSMGIVRLENQARV